MRFALGNLFFVFCILLPLKIIYDSWLIREKLPSEMSFFLIDWLPEPAKIITFRISTLVIGLVAIPYAGKGLISLWRGKDFDEIQ